MSESFFQEDISDSKQKEQNESIKVVQIFYCYDRKDRQHLVELEKRLNPLKDKLRFTTWWDEMITAGTDRNQEIMKQLKESGIVLLFVSPDYLNSPQCQTIQQKALDLYREEKLFRVIPIRLRHIDFEYEEYSALQLLPKYGDPVRNRRDKDEAWLEVQRGILEVVEEYSNQPQQASDVRDGFVFIKLYPSNGFHWDTELRPAPGFIGQADLPDSPWLVSEAVGMPEPSQRYSLFREKTILRDFATLSPTTDAIKEFADRYGDLGQSTLLIYPDKVGEQPVWAGESIQIWAEKIDEMNRLVRVWDMVQNRQIEALIEHVIWKLDPKCVLFIWLSSDGSSRRGSVIASEKISPELFYQFQWGEVIRPAWFFLINEVQQKLLGHVNPIFYPAQQKIYMVPDGLLSALYVLFLLEIQDHQIEPE